MTRDTGLLYIEGGLWVLGSRQHISYLVLNIVQELQHQVPNITASISASCVPADRLKKSAVLTAVEPNIRTYKPVWLRLA